MFVPQPHAIPRHARKGPRFLPGLTTQLAFHLVSTDGMPPQYSNYDFIFYVNSQSCTYLTGAGPGDGGYVCAGKARAPAGQDVYQIVASACGGAVYPSGACETGQYSLYTVSEAQTSIAVPPGGTASGHYTLNPVVGYLRWIGGANAGESYLGDGPDTPTYDANHSKWFCYSGNGCYDPIIGSSPAAYPIYIQPKDPHFDNIIPSASSVYGVPLYLQQPGAPSPGGVDSIWWTCNTPSLTLTTSTSTVANGRGGSYAAFNSPVLSPAYPSGTDFNGNIVTAVGNNGVNLSYDASYSLPYGQTFKCTVTDTQNISRDFYAGRVATPTPPPPPPPNPTLYVANTGTNGLGEIAAFQGGVYTSPSYVITGAYGNTFGNFYGPLPTSTPPAPQSIGRDSAGDLYVSDVTHDRFFEFPFGSSTQSTGEVDRADALYVDNANGRLFVGDGASGKVLVYSTGATPGYGFSMPLTSQYPAAMALDGAGDLFVSLRDFNEIDEFVAPLTPGETAQVIYPCGSTPGSLVWDTTHDTLWIGDYGADQIVGFNESTNGSFNCSYATIITNQIAHPVALAMDGPGYLYVANFSGQVTAYDAGNPTTPLVLNSATGGNDEPSDVIFDAHSNQVFVSYYGASEVDSYADQSPTIVTRYNQSISNPVAIAYDPNVSYLPQRPTKKPAAGHKRPLGL
ncbi:MAG: hypothetical protein JO199_11295 [Candidatus Eremiobacteraeota bacterium]|nr:hypothetical protein [Candidatus Eremiobacteraeota bacterium]